MALYLSTVGEAYGPLITDHWESKEDPQHYQSHASSYVHDTPHRHVLGLIGGNEVSFIKGSMVDLESDLRGINLPNTFCPSQQYQPPLRTDREIVRENRKGTVRIDVEPVHLPTYQMWAYPSVAAPLPMVSEVCQRPEKY
jgi:hypothetical protein